MSLPLRIGLSAVLQCLLVWALATFLPQYFLLTGGLPAIIIVGALLTLLNLVVRPLLLLLTLPLRLLMSLLAFLVVNAAFVWLTLFLTSLMQPQLVTVRLQGGWIGWLLTIVAFGLANAVMKVIL